MEQDNRRFQGADCINIEERNTSTIFVRLGAAMIVISLVLLIFGDLIIYPDIDTIGDHQGDVSSFYIHWRTFAFDQIRQGNLPLWNPYVHSGTPFMEDFRSALFYPINLIFLGCTISQYVNWSIVIHLILSGIFTFLWLDKHRLNPAACMTGSVIFMFSGALFCQIHQGHLSALCAIPWIPLLFFSIDGFLNNYSYFYWATGVISLVMQLLSGYPQILLGTFLAASLYFLAQLIRSTRPIFAFVSYLGMTGAAIVTTAVQWLPGCRFGESRLAPNPFDKSLGWMPVDPISIITWVAPKFFGDFSQIPYWGVVNSLEFNFYIGGAGLILAMLGIFCSGQNTTRILGVIAIILIVLGLNICAPFWNGMISRIPNDYLFLEHIHLLIPCILIFSYLAGNGCHVILESQWNSRPVILTLIPAVLILIILAASIQVSAILSPDNGAWFKIQQYFFSQSDSLTRSGLYQCPDFIDKSARVASDSMLITATAMLALILCIYFSRFSVIFAYICCLVVIVEMGVFARSLRSTFDINEPCDRRILEFTKQNPGDYRVLYQETPNYPMSIGVANITGFKTKMPDRYAEFISRTQSLVTHHGSNPPVFTYYHPLYRMLGCRYAFIPNLNQILIEEHSPILPSVQLFRKWDVLPDHHQLMDRLFRPDFDPLESVLLEEAPFDVPVSIGRSGRIQIIESSTDHYVIDADLSVPEVLLVRNNFAPGWKITPLDDSASQRTIIPANLTLQAIPLQAGHHMFKIAYLPALFRVGQWTSLLAAAVFGVWSLIMGFSRIFSLNSKIFFPRNRDYTPEYDDRA